MSTNKNHILRVLTSALSQGSDHRSSAGAWSALALGLAVTAGTAHAQGTPTDAAPPAAVTAPLSDSQMDQVKKLVAAMPKLFEFDGYFRAGFGINAKGGDQDAFQAPLAYSKYRLGNETETYGELGLSTNWINPEHNDTWFKTKVKLALVAPRNSTFDSLRDPTGNIAVREAYAEAGHLIESHPEMTFWAGQRFYRRRDVHIIDFFFNDMSGYGAGFQDMKLGSGNAKLSVAYLGGSVENAAMGSSDLGRLTKNTLDLRVSDIPAGPGNLEFWLIPTLARQGSDMRDNHSGIGGGVFYFMPVLGGFNEVSVSAGYNAAANLSSSLSDSPFIPSGGWLLRLVERGTFQLSPTMSMMVAGVLQFDNKDGSPDGSADSSLGNTWVSFGARPVFMLGKYTGVAVEGGADITRSQVSGASLNVLTKLTVAGLIRPANDFWARPELRVFVTGAVWNTPARDLARSLNSPIGGAAFVNDTAGLTAGVQAESWW